MTKKDYILISDAIADVRRKAIEGKIENGQGGIINCLISNFNALLARDNARFNPSKFTDACLK